jgi:hypothetical protein
VLYRKVSWPKETAWLLFVQLVQAEALVQLRQGLMQGLQMKLLSPYSDRRQLALQVSEYR